MKKVLWVVDTPGWALDQIAKEVQKRIKGVHIDINYDPNLRGVHTKQYDKIFFGNWLLGCKYPNRYYASICSHNFHLKWDQRAKEKMPKFKGLVCISKILEEKLAGKNKNIYQISNGIDTEMFKPCPNKGNFTVGFVSQKTSGGFGKGRTNEGVPKWDIKGYELLFKPLYERLKGKMKFKILTNNYTNAIPYHEMPKWYESIDVLICTSLWEGCPLPVLEAASCGKTVVSTNVGIVPELISHAVNGYKIIPPRKQSDIPEVLQEFEKHLTTLQKNRTECAIMGLENRERVQKFSWENTIGKWRDFFNG